MPRFFTSPAELFFQETDPLAEALENTDLGELAEEWLAAISGDGTERAHDQRSVRPMPPRPVRR
jgi:hypothetical protein